MGPSIRNAYNAKRREKIKDSHERQSHNELERKSVTKRANDKVDTIRLAPDLCVERAGPYLGVCVERVRLVANDEVQWLERRISITKALVPRRGHWDSVGACSLSGGNRDQVKRRVEGTTSPLQVRAKLGFREINKDRARINQAGASKERGVAVGHRRVDVPVARIGRDVANIPRVLGAVG